MTVYSCLIAVFLLCLAYHTYTDIREMLLYDAINAVLLVSGCIYAYFYGSLWQSLHGAVTTGGIMMLLYILSKGGMGEGDVKLAFVLGVWLGTLLGIVGLFLAFSSGGLIAIGLLVTAGKARREKLPFGPFLCLGGAVALLYGNNIIELYLSYF